MLNTDYKKEIVSNLRGFFLTQIIGTLGYAGVIDRMLGRKFFYLKDFKNLKSIFSLEIIFRYLCRIGYLKKNKRKKYYFFSDLGLDVFKRHSSFYVPYSYKNYLHSLKDILSNTKKNITVDRELNVMGSGKTHLRYFIPSILYLKKDIKPTCIIDIGVGNGDFLFYCCNQLNLSKVVGIDLSKISIKVSNNKLKKKSKIKSKLVCENAENISIWYNKIKNFIRGQKVVITMWFLLHEISNGKTRTIINFLKKVKKKFPNSYILICELNNVPYEVLASNKEFSVIPEYLFFHDLSHQGVLGWDETKMIIKKSGYSIKKKFLFDTINSKDIKRNYPSTFALFLEPN